MEASVTQQFLESSQYSVDKILENEKLFGRNFYITGGPDEVVEMLRLGEPMQPRRILDAGSGLGGPAFLMARRYPDAYVDGIDLSQPMFQLAEERLRDEGLAGRVRFFHGDILTFDPEVRYDLVFSSNVFLHIHDKDRLLERLHGLLADGGLLLFGDHCVGEESADMRAYIDHFRYHMPRMAEWTQLLAAHGFQKVVADDCTRRFSDYCESAVRVEGIGPAWKDILTRRLGRIGRGEHRWCVFCYRR